MNDDRGDAESLMLYRSGWINSKINLLKLHQAV